MDLSPEIIALGTELATIAGRMSVQTIFDKMKAVKQKDNKDEVISSLEEIINELITDKNSLIRISQAYEEKLMTQKMTESRLTNFEAAQGCSKEVILVLDAYYRESLNQLTKAKWEFNDARSRLEQIVGADALKQFENNLKTRKS